ncbi:nuclear transport factor 2 family protein [Ancylobacter radicis]|uniref:Nuclear transport factor 2 family protein n=1 Tax=Ancylobacter radicis TaxID=2836179 RepID=A0ABS5RC87_9HYPH|nr:nuclear transport factor 2 family protein [Ancylobacter radicis]MBS9478454.1 nuclear transport factor 2 family protein [Ancylobacter radicis]
MVLLPVPLRDYFEANASFDQERMLASFSGDAVVHDERRSHRGSAAIRDWIAEATLANQAIAVPFAFRMEEGRYVVEATVSGAFAGSPVRLSFHFRLADDKIVELEIG